LSVLLSLVGHAVLEEMSSTLLMQTVVSIAGIALMIVAATLLTLATRLEGRKPQLF
jgi:hypothetical protein